MKEHQWIVAVCEDLADYAKKKGLVETGHMATEAARIARQEIKLAETLEVKPTPQTIVVTLGNQRWQMGKTQTPMSLADRNSGSAGRSASIEYYQGRWN